MFTILFIVKFIYISIFTYKTFVLFVDPKNINWRREDINAVSPLLEAYQTSLEEKDVTIESYKNELARFSSRSREIAAENENLYQQLEEANEKVFINKSKFSIKLIILF